MLRYNVVTGVVTEDATDAVMTACESFTGGSSELELSTDASGYAVYTNGDYHITINQSGEIVDGEVTLFNSVDTIGIEGVVQVFADENCTQYATGNEQLLYVRSNIAIDKNYNKEWGDQSNLGSYMMVSSPVGDVPPTDPDYISRGIDLYNAYNTGEVENPISVGQVLLLQLSGGIVLPIANNKVIFREPNA